MTSFIGTSFIKTVSTVALVIALMFALVLQAHAATLSDLAGALTELEDTLDTIVVNQAAPTGQVLGIDIDALTYPSLQSVQGHDDPVVAYNLGGINDWAPSHPFLNIAKYGRNWTGHLPGQWGGWGEAELEAEGYLDENGYPTEIPAELTRLTLHYAWGGDNHPTVAGTRAGSYVLTYEGEGDLRMWSGANNVQVDGKTITFDVTGDQTWGIEIYSVTPGDHIRNIVIVKEEHVPLYEAGAQFNPDYLELLKDVRQLRFMDWGETNNSDVTQYSEIKSRDHYTYTTHGGVPLAVMVDLANEIGADPWFNFPFHFTDAAVQQYAQYVRDNLDPDLKAHFELSNEVWNWSFSQTHDAQDLGEAEFNVTTGPRHHNYYGKRSYEVMKIVTDVFGAEADDRIVRVVHIQTGGVWGANHVFNASQWQDADPTNFVSPHTYFDAMAITTYFGGSIVGNETNRSAFLAAGDRQAFLREAFNDETNPSITDTPTNNLASIAEAKVFADGYGIDIIIYEGPQHMLHSFSSNIPDEDINAMIDDVNEYIRSEDMANIYEWQFNEWQNIGGDGPFMQFSDVKRVSKYGAWGLRESLVDNPPRALKFDELNNDNTAWWESRSGAHFQQGRIVVGTSGDNTLAGTSQEDFLIGGDGEDTLYAGPGNDGVNGGPMEDVLMLRGSQSQYTVNSEGDGYRVVGPDGSDYVYAVEILYFEDGTTRALEGDINEGSPVPDPVDPDPVAAFSAGDRIVLDSNVNVREPAGTANPVLGVQNIDAIGTVLGITPVEVNGYTWIAVDFDAGSDGWIADEFASVYVPGPDPVIPDPVDPGPVDPGPVDPGNSSGSKTIRNYIFGHSLIHHEAVNDQPFTAELAVPNWIHRFAEEAGNTYLVDGQYGFMQKHVNELPPGYSWTFEEAQRISRGRWVTDPFADQNYDTILMTPLNYVQHGAPDAPYYNEEVKSVFSYTVELIDYLEQTEPGTDMYIYMNWPGFGGTYGRDWGIGEYPLTPAEMGLYHEGVQNEWVAWWDEYYRLVVEARPDADLKMIPVAPLMSAVLDDVLNNQITSQELYEDSAPHGRPTTYFLAGLVTYMAMYGEKVPTTYDIPNTVHPLVRSNFQTIVDYMWTELAPEFGGANAPDPVDPVDPVVPDLVDGGREASPIDVMQIHSGHSLTDSALFKGQWPWHHQALLNTIDPGSVTLNVNLGKSTLPGSPMKWRWENAPNSGPDARGDIADWELLVITEAVPLASEPGQYNSWQRQLDYIEIWAEHAYENGDNGNGAPMMLYSTWGSFEDQTPAQWRAELDEDAPVWELMADTASAAVPEDFYVWIIPGNRLMMELYDDIERGEVPGITDIRDLFADNIHANEIGSYALSLLHLYTIHHIDPRGQAYTGLRMTEEPSAELAAYLQNTVYEVVNDYPRAGVSGDVVAPDPVDPGPVDSDFDSVPDETDNCPNVQNADQFDNDNDGIGNQCDDTPDGDVDPDPVDPDPVDPSPDPEGEFNVIRDTAGPDGLVGTDADDYFILTGTGGRYRWDVVHGLDGIDYIEMPASITVYTSANPHNGSFNFTTGMELGVVAPRDDIEFLVFPEGTFTVAEAVAIVNGEETFPDPAPDADNDGIEDENDNCVDDSNASQTDSDNDGAGDACDATPNGGPVNEAPEAVNDEYVTTAAVNLSGVNVLTNDIDLDADALSAEAFSNERGTNGGRFTVTSSGELSFDPDGDFDDLYIDETETTRINYTVSDGEDTDTGRIEVTVGGTQVRPVDPDPVDPDPVDPDPVDPPTAGNWIGDDAYIITDRGELYDSGNGVVIGDYGDISLVISPVNRWSDTGRALSLSDTKTGYHIVDNDATAEIEGQTVSQNYQSRNNNRADADSPKFAGSADQTALALSSIVIDVATIGGGAGYNSITVAGDTNVMVNGGTNWINATGEGDNVLYFEDSITSYEGRESGARYVVEHTDGSSVNMQNFETLSFAGIEYTLEQAQAVFAGEAEPESNESGSGSDNSENEEPEDPGRMYNLQNIKERIARNNELGKDYQLRINRVANQCDVSRFEAKAEQDVKEDEGRNYPLGLFDMTLECVDMGAAVTQEIVLDAVYDTSEWELRKYSARTDEYSTVNPALVTYAVRDGVTVIQYEITDGGILDDDQVVNGVIVDPIGPAIPDEPADPESDDTSTDSSSGGSGSGSSGSSSGSSSGGSSSGSSGSSSSGGSNSNSSANTSSAAETTAAPVTTSLPATDVFKSNVSFNQPSINSSVDVRNLQQFLNDFEGESLAVTGTYDSASNEAIKRFQRKYRREILDIWDLDEATGYVGVTTRLKMNFLLKGQTAQCPVFTEYHGGKADTITFSSEIGEVQKILTDLDMYNGPINNTWGPYVHEAVIVFQETFREVMLDPWDIAQGTGRQYKTTNKFLNYFAGCDTGAIELEGVGVYEGI